MVHALENHVLLPYCNHFIKLSEQDPEPLYAPLNENVRNLQLPMWISKMGRLPDCCYWGSMDPALREYATEEMRQQDLTQYGFNAKTEAHFSRLLRSSLRRHGLSEARFAREIKHHYSARNESRQLTAAFLLCEEVMADVGTFAANTAYYTSDYRFVTQWNGKTRTSRMVGLDSWDCTLLNDEGRGDDCEGMGNTTTTIIRAFAIGRQDLQCKWESEAMNAAQLLLAHTVLYDVGATVTSEYVDTNNAKVQLDKAQELPMVGDEMDLRSHSDGHCFALMGSLSDALVRLQAGNVGEDVLGKVRAAIPATPGFRERDAQRRTLVLEPTSSIEPRILPVEEAYAQAPELCAKRRAERLFFKALRADLDARKADKGAENLAEMFCGEGFQYYVERQHPRRRVSSFYNEPVMGCSIDLWKRFDLSLGQFAFCTVASPQDVRYGVKIADYLRTATNFSLVCPFYENREEWKRSVLPFVESVQHQLPLMSFGRYSDEKYAQLHSTHVAASDLGEAKKFLPATGTTATAEPSQPAQLRFEKLASEVVDDANLSIVRLYSRPWKFQQSEKRTREFVEFMANCKGLVAHAYFTEHQLPVCDPCVEILCIIDVGVCLKMKPQEKK